MNSCDYINKHLFCALLFLYVLFIIVSGCLRLKNVGYLRRRKSDNDRQSAVTTAIVNNEIEMIFQESIEA